MNRRRHLKNIFDIKIYGNLSKDRTLPLEIRMPINYSDFNPSVCFIGSFMIGLKDNIKSFVKLFNIVLGSSVTSTTSVGVVDNLKRTNSTTINKMREEGILILDEFEFYNILTSIKSDKWKGGNCEET